MRRARKLVDGLLGLLDDESGCDCDPDSDIFDVWCLNRRRT